MLLSLAQTCLAFGLPLVLADVEFTSPASGINVPVGTIDVKWKDSGKLPLIEDLTQYTLVLVVGGNEEDNMLPLATFVSQGDFSSGDFASGTIPAGIAESIPNGFFFKMISAATQGGTVTDYSNRFNITGLTGITDSLYRNAAEALDSTNGPPRQVNVVGISASASASITTATSSTSHTPKSIVTVTASPSSTTHASNPSRMSTGVLVGITIGAIILMALIALGIWALFRQAKRRRDGTEKSNDEGDVSEVGWRKGPSDTALSELSTEGRMAEMSDSGRPSEMDSMNVRAELPGDFVHDHLEMQGSPVISPSEQGEGQRDALISPLSRYDTNHTISTLVSPLSRPMTPRDASPVTPVSAI